MSEGPDEEILGQLTRVLYLACHPDEDPDQEAPLWMVEFKSTHSTVDILLYLTLVYSDSSILDQIRTVAAIVMFSLMAKRTPDAQRSFVREYVKYDPDIRDKIRETAIEYVGDIENESLCLQSANLLGLFFALEFSTVRQRTEHVIPEFVESFQTVLNIADETPDPNLKIILLQFITVFCRRSFEINNMCTQEQLYVKYCDRIFEVVHACMEHPCDMVQVKAMETMMAALKIFRRVFSFSFPGNQRDRFMETLFEIMTSGIPEFLAPSYALLKRFIECYYSYTAPHIDAIVEITFEDMASGIEEKQIEACSLWSTIGDVERKMQREGWMDGEPTFRFADAHFDELFPILVEMIGSVDDGETDASIDGEPTVSHSAFVCFSSITRATEARALDMIFEFVTEYVGDDEWRVRYTVVHLLNAVSKLLVSQLSDVADQATNIMTVYDMFINLVADPVDKIADVAMWSLGKMVDEVPGLVTDPDRFQPLIEAVQGKLDESKLIFQCCRLLSSCFAAFSSDDEDTPLVDNFDAFSTMLLQAVECAESDVGAQEAAYEAINRLIENTPPSITESYNELFEKLTEKLGTILGSDDGTEGSTQEIIDLLFLIQTIVMNVGPLISSVTDDLMAMLIQSLEADNKFVCEVISAMGAVATAVGDAFAPFLPDLLPKLCDFLQEEEYFQRACICVGDIFHSIEGIESDLSAHFVDLLFTGLDRFENLTAQDRLACLNALSKIAQYVGDGCLEWIKNYMDIVENESRSALSIEGEELELNIDFAVEFTTETLQIYQTLVNIFSEVERGEKFVRNFFHIFDKILNFSNAINTEYKGPTTRRDQSCIDDRMVSLLPDVVILVRMIAETFGRKMNVYLNRPIVVELLVQARDSEDENLSELANETIDVISDL